MITKCQCSSCKDARAGSSSAVKKPTYSPSNTTYNVIDTLMLLNRKLWDDLCLAYSEDQEEFIMRCGDYQLPRVVAYTYWDAISFARSVNYRELRRT